MLAVVATPLASVAGVARAAARRRGAAAAWWSPTSSGVKAPVVAAVDHPRFVGGHPMAGSEQAGLDGADADLFVGATWVLTPTPTTDPERYADACRRWWRPRRRRRRPRRRRTTTVWWPWSPTCPTWWPPPS